jgi:hypothetical protein
MKFFRLPLKKSPFLLCILGFFIIPVELCSLGRHEKEKKIEIESEIEKKAVVTVATQMILAGADEGLFSVGNPNNPTALWTGGSVKKIVFAAGNENSKPDYWAILGSEGILVSADLSEWEKRNQGLPVKTIKIFRDGKKSFLQIVQEIKDLEINPADTNIMVCATRDSVYLSRNRGQSWRNLGVPPTRINGIKAVASAFMPRTGRQDSGGSGDLTVFLSHCNNGVFYIQPDRAGSKWTELSKGLEALETTGNADEVSDIAVRLIPQSTVYDPTAKNQITEIYVSQTFRRRIYRLDWNSKIFVPIWSDNSPFGTVDSLYVDGDDLNFIFEGTAASLDLSGSSAGKFIFRRQYNIQNTIRRVQNSLSAFGQGVVSATTKGRLNCVVMQNGVNSDSPLLTLGELWLLDEQEPDAAVRSSIQPVVRPDALRLYAPQAVNKEGLYLPVEYAIERRSLRSYLSTMEKSGLNMIIIDMKDEWGRLRFSPKNAAITAKGRVFRPLDIDPFLAEMKKNGIYTVARIVVFKDPELAVRENGRFAVWDTRNAKPWEGYYDTRRKKSEIINADRRNNRLRFFPANDPDYEIVRTFYDERWVDPYSEEVWEYAAALTEELYERGFDEIQFDYIRFPTDGVNLGDARYRWQDNGMDMESAILSFLRHIRSRVRAPISIDIYGANGWYRTNARTGQEVEILAPWVDVICPMYYPSHFEQHFLAQSPPELRPWRIYFYGTLRTSRISRGQAVIRPYVQAFFLNVSYDRLYYNKDYVRRQVDGVRSAGDGGFIYWNILGKYDYLPSG